MYKIEKGVPAPEGKESKYPFRAMEVGDSFFVPGGIETELVRAPQ